MAVQAWDVRKKSECRTVMVRIRIETLSGTKVSPRRIGLSSQENLKNHLYKEKQMTAMAQPLTGASLTSAIKWDTIKWHTVKAQVRRLQMRIAKATREGFYGKAKALQWILTHSLYAKLLAVKRVVQNHGGKTAGVDGVIWKTAKQKMQAVKSLQRRGYSPQPLRRVYIPKKNGKQRPLGIPPIKCRAMQALHLLALEPIAETLLDKNAYGFRPRRSTADAIQQCFITLAKKKSAQWILEGDIKSCFDKISHQWLLANIPMDKAMLNKWLAAGYMEGQIFHPTQEGTPQGGIISPTLMNMTLRGLEASVKNIATQADKVNVITYADDFIITGASKEVLENKIKPLVSNFLKERGLELSEEKTRTTHIDNGFDFLGFNVRKYKGKLLIKPTRKNVQIFLSKIRDNIKSNGTSKTENLIRQLNPKIRGWSNYFRHVVSKQTFDFVDHSIFKALWQWAKRRHPKKGAKWVRKKYFRTQGLRQWIFFSKNQEGTNLDLFRAAKVKIKRHVKVRAAATPYDPAYKDYFKQRSCLKKLSIRDAESIRT